MPCCGRGPRHTRPITRLPSRGQAEPPKTHSGPARSFVSFRYLGDKNLTVRGPVTGRSYQFTSHGSPVAVDARDGRYLAGVPGLRQVP